MTADVLSLYPNPGSLRPLRGLYLDHRLHEVGSTSEPLVYGNFVSSLDGRIALIDPQRGESYLPKDLTGGNDYRLFQELHAQADCLITHGGYLRALAQGQLGNVLQVNASGDSADLIDWRKQQGLPEQPAIVVTSGSLDFPVPGAIKEHGQPLYIATAKTADPARVRAWQQQGIELIVTSDNAMVKGTPLVRALSERGYKSLYLVAGPRMLETMLRDQKLSKLYLTLTHHLLGGEQFHTMIPGPPLGAAGRLKLRTLYYDPGNADQNAQWFAQFDHRRI